MAIVAPASGGPNPALRRNARLPSHEERSVVPGASRTLATSFKIL